MLYSLADVAFFFFNIWVNQQRKSSEQARKQGREQSDSEMGIDRMGHKGGKCIASQPDKYGHKYKCTPDILTQGATAHKLRELQWWVISTLAFGLTGKHEGIWGRYILFSFGSGMWITPSFELFFGFAVLPGQRWWLTGCGIKFGKIKKVSWKCSWLEMSLRFNSL